MKKYEKLINSEIEGTGDIPEHWKITRNKFIFYFSKKNVGKNSSEFDLLTLGKNGVNFRDKDNGKGKFPASFDSYQIVEPTDLIFCLFDIDETPRTIGYSNLFGMITSAYDVVKCFPNIDPKFIYFYYIHIDNQKMLRPYYTGLRKVVRSDTFLGLKIAIPNLTEQRQISNFLELNLQKNNSKIKKYQKIVDLLQQKKQSTIHNVMTKGLDSTVLMKDSKIEWIGNIPEHWKIMRTRFLVDITTGGKNTIDNNENGNYPFYVRSQKIGKINTYSCDEEAVLTAGDGAGVGKIFHYVNEKFDFHQRVYKMSNFKKITGKYFYLFFKENFQNEVFKGTAKTTVDSLRQHMIQNFPIVFGDEMEQNKIIQYLEKEISKTDSLMLKINLQIKKIQEYSTSLISSTVTGKIDIRE